MNLFLYFLAILPGLLISFYVFWLDRKNPESKISLLICFGLGMLVTIPAMKFEEIELLLQNDQGQLSFAALTFSTFVLVAIGEEFFKTLPLLLFAFPKKYFDEPFDGIVFAVMIAMGFATIENIFYAYRFGMSTTLVRAFTAVPAHGALAVVMGYYAGLAKFDPEQKYKLLAIGFIQAVLIHGFYDFFIIQEYNEDLMALAALILTLAIYYAIQLIRKSKNVSQIALAIEEENTVESDVDLEKDF